MPPRRLTADELASRLGHWSAGSTPLREQLAAALRAGIERGELQRGVGLPSDRTLARALSVSRTTTVAAYGALKREGWIEARPGGSTRVVDGHASSARPGSARRAAMFRRLLGDGAGEVIDLTLAALPALPGVQDALRAALEQDLPAALASHGYEPAGVAALRGGIANHFTRRGVPTRPEQILVTTGTQQGLATIAAALVAAGDRVVVEEVTHPGALTVLRDAGAVLHPVPVGMAAERPDVLEAALGGGTRLVYCIPTHHNPTGSVMGAAARRRLAQAAADHDVTLVEDCTLDDLALGPERSAAERGTGRHDLDGPERPPPLAATDVGATVLTVGSVSKSHWGGLRVGWVRAPEPLVQQLLAHKAAADLGSAVLDQHAARRLLEAGTANVALERRRRLLAAQRDALEEALRAQLPGWRWRTPSGGLSLWVDLGGVDGGAFAQTAMRRGVAVAPGAEFAAGAGGAGHIRLSFAAPTDLLREGVARLASAWGPVSTHGRLEETAPRHRWAATSPAANRSRRSTSSQP